MAFVTLDNVAVGDPIRAIEFGQRTKENFDDLNTRTSALEGTSAAAIVDHAIYDDQAIDAGAPVPAHDLWKFAGSNVDANNNCADSLLLTDHIMRLRCTYTANGTNIDGRRRGVVRLTPPQRPRVLFRCRVSDFTPAEGTILSFGIGMANDRALGVSATDGVFLEISAGSFRFAARKNSSQTSGSTFTIAADNAWFTVEIKYIDGDSVECYSDGTLRSTFNGPTDNVPDGFGDIMYAEVGGGIEKNVANANVHTWDIDTDRVRYELQLLADAA